MASTLIERLPESASALSGCRQLFVRDLQKRTGDADFLDITVALRGEALFLVKWLALLDGRVKRIALIPRAADQKLLSHVIDGCSADWLVCDDDAGVDVSKCSVHVDRDFSASLPFISDEFCSSQGRDGRTIVTQWVLATSGTTQTPKLVSHTLESLTRSMKVETRHARLRWGLMYDSARFAGLQVLLQSLLNGATLLVPPVSLSLAEQIRWLAANGCSALSATPTLWRKTLMVGGLERLPLRQITMGGEIADAVTLRAMSARFPDARLTHVYASTEAGVGFAVHDKQPGFPVCWLDSGVRGVQLKIGSNGCLWMSPQRVEQSYIGATEPLTTSDGWIDTGDVVRLEGERVYFCGRLNGSMNIGGNKVFPEEVESAILEVEGVLAVLVRARPSSVMGGLVEAFVVLDTTVQDVANDLIARVRSHCREKLESYKVPAFIKLVNDVEISPAGKISRNL